MRKFIILGAAVAALGLAACGDTETITTTETTTTEAPTTTVTVTEEQAGWSQTERDDFFDFLTSPPDALSARLARCAVRKAEDRFSSQIEMSLLPKRERTRVAEEIVTECYAEGSS